MTWNHRVMRQGDSNYIIVEAYYTDGVADSFAEGITPYGETKEELRACLERMLKALDKPTLIIEDGKLKDDTRTI